MSLTELPAQTLPDSHRAADRTSTNAQSRSEPDLVNRRFETGGCSRRVRQASVKSARGFRSRHDVGETAQGAKHAVSYNAINPCIGGMIPQPATQLNRFPLQKRKTAGKHARASPPSILQPARESRCQAGCNPTPQPTSPRPAQSSAGLPHWSTPAGTG